MSLKVTLIFYFKKGTIIKRDIDFLDEMNCKWLLENGWTIKGNIAYRRILEMWIAYNKTITIDQIIAILKSYKCTVVKVNKIKEALSETLSLKNDIEGLIKEIENKESLE